MPTTEEFFSSYLPHKLEKNPELKSIGAVFQFDISEAGNWTVDLSAGSVTQGNHDSPGCVITTDRSTWEGILETPSRAMAAAMTGKLKASNIGLAMKLQQILA